MQLFDTIFVDSYYEVTVKQVEDDGITVNESSETETYYSKYIAIATGHHAKPSIPKFLGQDSFKGKTLLSAAVNHKINFLRFSLITVSLLTFYQNLKCC